MGATDTVHVGSLNEIQKLKSTRGQNHSNSSLQLMSTGGI